MDSDLELGWESGCRVELGLESAYWVVLESELACRVELESELACRAEWGLELEWLLESDWLVDPGYPYRLRCCWRDWDRSLPLGGVTAAALDRLPVADELSLPVAL